LLSSNKIKTFIKFCDLIKKVKMTAKKILALEKGLKLAEVKKNKMFLTSIGEELVKGIDGENMSTILEGKYTGYMYIFQRKVNGGIAERVPYAKLTSCPGDEDYDMLKKIYQEGKLKK